MNNVALFYYKFLRTHHARGACYHFGTGIPSVPVTINSLSGTLHVAFYDSIIDDGFESHLRVFVALFLFVHL